MIIYSPYIHCSTCINISYDLGTPINTDASSNINDHLFTILIQNGVVVQRQVILYLNIHALSLELNFR